MDLITIFGILPSASSGASSAPVNTIAPALDNTTPRVGQTLTPSEGTWTNPIVGRAWLWFGDGVSLGVTTENYTVQASDIGTVLKRRSIFSNSGGDSTPVFSDQTSAILSNVCAFTVDGTPQINGATVNLANGTTDATIAATNGGSITAGPTGDTGLSEGDNSCAFTLTAADGIATLDVTINLHVLDVGTAEVTDIQTFDIADDVAWSGTHFGLSDNAGRVGIFIDRGAQGESTTVHIPKTSQASDFVTGGPGRAIVIDSSAARVGFWFQAGTETQPDLSGQGVTEYRQVDIDPITDDAEDVAIALHAVADGDDFITSAVDAIGNPAYVFFAIIPDATGARTDAVVVNDGGHIDFVIGVQGRDNASAPGGYDRTLRLSLVGASFSASSVASALAALLNFDGAWAASNTDDIVTVTDAAIGARTDAANVSAPFGITVTTQGADPA